jgi:spermidine/putrescine transport system permease protein
VRAPRLRRLLPYALLAPGLGWLVLFFAIPLYYMAKVSLESGTLDTGFQFTWEFSNYTKVISDYSTQFLRSFEYAGLATLLALLIGYPLAYTIAFRGGKWRNALLLAVILPFFVTYLIRTLSWQTILDDDGWVVSMLQSLGLVSEGGRVLATSGAVIAGITYNFLPFMILPLYASGSTPGWWRRRTTSTAAGATPSCAWSFPSPCLGSLPASSSPSSPPPVTSSTPSCSAHRGSS